jgi:signal transduction histidine kinase/DNA-binding response OmpR family regulator
MIRFEDKTPPALFVGVWLSTVAVAIADYYAPMGVAIFILYMVPVVLTFFTWRRMIPFIIAGVGTALIAMDYFMAAEVLVASETQNIDIQIAQWNRGFGVITLWMLAGIGHLFIRNRLMARMEAWLQAGETKLASMISGEQRLDELGDNVLKFVVEYLDAQAGAIFMADGGRYQRCSVYAVAAGSVPENFELEHGLLGQAAKDGRHFVVNDVPDGYLSVGSSLGESKPRHLLIKPISLEGSVNAVLELGFFKPVKDSDVALLKSVESLIGVAVRSVKYRMRLQELLEETQRQSEEVQAQSEELRVSNEELEEQGRALRESQSRLELQQAELEQINTQLEEQTQFLERQKNDLLEAKSDAERQAREVEIASRYKSDFLANMSHELRTPLNSSLILAKLLAENASGNLTPEQVKYATTIESAGNDLLTLINDVLDLSKIEAGHMEIVTEPVSLKQLVGGLQNTFEPVAGQKGLDLRIEVDPETPRSLVTDPQRLEQILKNLLSNALKFTERGSVTLRVSTHAGSGFAFQVTDTGIGITEDQQRIIFDPFFQGDGTTARKYGGTGLGLSISRNLVRMLGGELKLTSELGKGSEFTVLLPAEHDGSKGGEDFYVPERPIQSNSSQPVSVSYQRKGTPDDREHLTGDSRVILTVEDDISFARIVYDLAREMDFQCLIATTAEEALVLAQQYLPSAIVLDVGLPDNSGLLVLERLKADSRTRHIPVHVVSASDYSKTALALGAVGYMLKPVKREHLIETFRKLETRLSQKMRRVLVVEDDPVQVEAMRDLLGSRDVEAICAQTAAECLEQLERSTFDCMVLDLSLPDASGFSLLEKLSAEDTYSFPPVIVYTGRQLTPDEEQKLRRYSKSIIIKGAKSPERLLDEVTLFLHQVVSDLPLEKQKMLEKSNNRDAALEGRRILIAEDDVRNVYALTSLLEGRGVKLQIARNGHEALAALDEAAKDPEKMVNLVLMDIMMPEMDGLTAMREIRKRREWQKLPIIALTAKAMKSDQEQCIQAGANDYLAKPLDVDKLLSLIRVWMPR